jgi:hypothetical protein
MPSTGAGGVASRAESTRHSAFSAPQNERLQSYRLRCDFLCFGLHIHTSYPYRRPIPPVSPHGVRAQGCSLAQPPEMGGMKATSSPALRSTCVRGERDTSGTTGLNAGAART